MKPSRAFAALLRAYLDSMPAASQHEFAVRCGTSRAYLRKLGFTGQQVGESLAIKLDRESGGSLPFTKARSDVDWEYVAARLSGGLVSPFSVTTSNEHSRLRPSPATG